MIQKFYDDTLVSKFIKHLLATENVPLCNVIKDGDILFMNNLYVYQSWLLYCTRSGVFRVPADSLMSPGQTIYSKTAVDAQTGTINAEYKIIRHYVYNQYIPKVTSTYVSNVTYYDSETHFQLGRYLRYRSNLTGVNLMPFYNCYSGKTTDDVHFSKHVTTANFSTTTTVSLDAGSNISYKVFCVPIRFNKQYTIAIDCSSELFIGYRIYDQHTGVIYHQGSDLSAHLSAQNTLIHTASFKKPFLAMCTLSPSDSANDIYSKLYSQENNLQMLIQVPSDNTSSVVVLEGDFRQQNLRIHNLLDDVMVSYVTRSGDGDSDLAIEEQNVTINTNPLLLSINTKNNYAFTGRLLEHLLLNTVNSTDSLTENITRLQELLRKKDPIYNYRFINDNLSYGVWSEIMSKAMARQIANIQTDYHLNDMNGEFNCDLEKYYQTIRKVNLSNVK